MDGRSGPLDGEPGFCIYGCMRTMTCLLSCLLLLVLSLLGCGYVLNLSWFDKVVKMARGIKVMRKKPKRA